MKDSGTKSLRAMGGLTLCHSLLKADLVDRFRVVVFRVITGSSGRDRIYDGYPDVALDMVSSRTFDRRLQLLEYVPTVLAGPPSTKQDRCLTKPAPGRPPTGAALHRQGLYPVSRDARTPTRSFPTGR